ncbi:CCA-adding enzyme [Listeria immobilis]|uniref:CCA-adding enzyme n=1 Tax=Listeria immobilis TaxID=2713502 RepID=UPI00162AE399|nr:CCA-adding enzyme [Listeria immobilis]MBC1516264.1 CCA-adding enzyme [Listeria immobilis]
MATEIRVLKNTDNTVFYPKTHLMAIEGLNEATSNTAGLMAPSDKTKLNSIEANAEKNNVTAADISNWNKKQDTILTSENGFKFKIVVTDTGELKTTKVD